MHTMKRTPLLLLLTVLLAGCGPSPNVDTMKTGLVKAGMPADQASCYAEAASKTVKGEPYNFLADLLSTGLSEDEAVNKTRRKYSADFKEPLKEARAKCVKPAGAAKPAAGDKAAPAQK